MSKPLGYYVSLSPGEDTILTEVEKRYGSYLEGISVREKLFLVQELARDLSLRASGSLNRSEIYWLQYDLCRKLAPSDKEGMIQALIAQIRVS